MEGGGAPPFHCMSHEDKKGYATSHEARFIAKDMARRSCNPVWIYSRGKRWFVTGCVNLYGHRPCLPAFDKFMRAYPFFTYEKPVPLPDVYYVMYAASGYLMLRGTQVKQVSEEQVDHLLKSGNVIVMSHAQTRPNGNAIQRDAQYRIRQPVAWRDVGKRTTVLYSHPEAGMANHILSNGRFVYDALTTAPMMLPREETDDGQDTRRESEGRSRCHTFSCEGLQHNPYDGWVWQERHG